MRIELSDLTDEEAVQYDEKLVFPDGIKVSKHLVVDTLSEGISEIRRIPVAEKDGKFVIPAPSEVLPELTGPPELIPPQKTAWENDGATLKVVKVLAESGELFGKPGVTVRFYDREVVPGASTAGMNSVEIFFPKNGTGYGRPISVTFNSPKGGMGQFQESKGGGYNARLNSTKDKVSGWVNISGAGPRSESLIAAKFEADLPKP